MKAMALPHIYRDTNRYFTACKNRRVTQQKQPHYRLGQALRVTGV
jgi:hypothetical protein